MNYIDLIEKLENEKTIVVSDASNGSLVSVKVLRKIIEASDMTDLDFDIITNDKTRERYIEMVDGKDGVRLWKIDKDHRIGEVRVKFAQGVQPTTDQFAELASICTGFTSDTPESVTYAEYQGEYGTYIIRVNYSWRLITVLEIR